MERDDVTYKEAWDQVKKEFSKSGLAKAGIQAAQELDLCAKVYQEDNSRLSAAEAFDKVRSDNPGLAARAAGYEMPWRSGDGLMNPEDSTSRSIPKQQIAALVVAVPPRDDGKRSINAMVRIANEYIDTAREMAGAELLMWSKQWILNQGLPNLESWHLSTAFRAAQAMHPTVSDLYNGGVVSAEAFIDIFPSFGWY